ARLRAEEVHLHRALLAADAIGEDRDERSLLDELPDPQHEIDALPHLQEASVRFGRDLLEHRVDALGVLRVHDRVEREAFVPALGAHRVEAPEMRAEQDRATPILFERVQVLAPGAHEAEEPRLAGYQEERVERDLRESEDLPVKPTERRRLSRALEVARHRAARR